MCALYLCVDTNPHKSDFRIALVFPIRKGFLKKCYSLTYSNDFFDFHFIYNFSSLWCPNWFFWLSFDHCHSIVCDSISVIRFESLLVWLLFAILSGVFRSIRTSSRFFHRLSIELDCWSFLFHFIFIAWFSFVDYFHRVKDMFLPCGPEVY